jgi:hypothetical protein
MLIPSAVTPWKIIGQSPHYNMHINPTIFFVLSFIKNLPKGLGGVAKTKKAKETDRRQGRRTD